MRHNNRMSIDRFDRVYIDVPQCKWLRSMVAAPLKTIYYNRAADPGANIDRLFTNVIDLEMFVVNYMIDLH